MSKNKRFARGRDYAPKWMNPKNHLVGEQGVHYGFSMPKTVTKDEARMLKSTVRKALHHELYTHMSNAKKGVKGFNPYQLPSNELFKRLGVDKTDIARAAKLWRKEFGFNTIGHRGGLKTKANALPKNIAFKAWYDSAAGKRVILMSDLIITAGKQGILVSPNTMSTWIRNFNSMLDKQARVRIEFGKLKPNTTLAEISDFLKEKNIYGAKSTARHVQE